MAEAIQVAGVAAIKVGTGSESALELLGYTRNGAEVRVEGFFLDVPGDQNGGDNGPPIDVQYFGERAIIRLELTKWDSAIADKCTPRLKGGTLGQPGSAGTLMFAGNKTYRLLLHTTAVPFNFPRAFPRDAIEINKGTRFSILMMTWEAHKDDNGVLYNAITS